jgi:hypothetical protein
MQSKQTFLLHNQLQIAERNLASPFYVFAKNESVFTKQIFILQLPLSVFWDERFVTRKSVDEMIIRRTRLCLKL